MERFIKMTIATVGLALFLAGPEILAMVLL